MEIRVQIEAVGSTHKKKATYADLEALPETVLGQIVDGELIALPRPAFGHAAAAGAIFRDLSVAFELASGGPGGWWLLFEPELHFGDDVLVPDLAGWREGRIERRSVPYTTVAPDWLCEVLSPSTARLDRVRKLRIYAREKVGHVWLVDPAARTFEVLKLDGAQWQLLGTYGDAERVRAEPFAAVELDLGRLWLPEPEAPEAAPNPKEPTP